MDFSEALKEIKKGSKVARKNWNGKGMYIYLDLFDYKIDNDYLKNKKYEPCIIMRTAQGLHQPGWLASQLDLLAEDWEVV